MGENFPEGTSASDPSAVPPLVPPLDREALEDVPPEMRDEDRKPQDEPAADAEPENQQTG